MILRRFWASWRFLGGKQPSGGGKAGRDLQVVVIWKFSPVLMEGLRQTVPSSLITVGSSEEGSYSGLMWFWLEKWCFRVPKR